MSERGQAWFGIRWLDAVRAHPDRTRYAVIAANALWPYMNNSTGRAIVTQERMSDDQRQAVKALRRGFRDLERMGLLRRQKDRKPGSAEFDVTVYHPRLTDLPTDSQGTNSTGGDRPQNYSRDSGLRVEKGSKRPLDDELLTRKSSPKSTGETEARALRRDSMPSTSTSTESKRGRPMIGELRRQADKRARGFSERSGAGSAAPQPPPHRARGGGGSREAGAQRSECALLRAAQLDGGRPPELGARGQGPELAGGGGSPSSTRA